VAPFLQLTTHPTKSFSPCPYLGGTTWAQDYGTIQQRWASADLESLRYQFLNNQRPDMCQRCWHEEDNNKQSLRLRLYNSQTKTSDYSVINNSTIVQEMIEGLAQKEYLKGPKILTIKNGNVCNAKCRVCHPGDSSRWVEDANKLASVIGPGHYAINVSEKNWSTEQLDEIYELSKNLKRLELFGGEPLYNKKVLSLLDRIAKNGHSKQLNLYINTNGSVNLIDKVPRVHEFKEVEIGVSIDGIDKQFEYIRHGIKYKDVVDNILTWQKYFKEKNTKFFIDSITTVSVFNIFSLPEIKQEITKLLPQSPFWNLLVNPDHLFIRNMPDKVKQKVIAKLQSDPEFSDIISVINQPADSDAWDKFLSISQALDVIRNENFKDTFPELSAAIDL
jgi:sulfatase maturation enzyme AslB (radical SAM superfamily)